VGEDFPITFGGRAPVARHSDPQAKWVPNDGSIGDFADKGVAVEPLTAAPRDSGHARR